MARARAEKAPQAEHVATAAAVEGPQKEEQRDRAEQREQGVGARLLGVPKEHWIDGDKRRCDQAGAASAELGGDQVGDRHARNSGQRRNRAKADFGGTGQLRPKPGERVVKRRRRLAGTDGFHRMPETAAEDAAGGDHLIVVIALLTQGPKAQQRGQQRSARPAPKRRGSGAAPPGVRAPPRSTGCPCQAPPPPSTRPALPRSPWKPHRRRRTPARCARWLESPRRRPGCARERAPA